MNYPTGLPLHCPNCGDPQRTKSDPMGSWDAYKCGAELWRDPLTGDTHFEIPCSKVPIVAPVPEPVWIEHSGGPQPVGDDVKVICVRKDGKQLHEAKARTWRWIHFDSGSDIVRYRLAETVKPATQATPDPAYNWIPWSGGDKCPVTKGTSIEIRFRTGSTHKAGTDHNWNWKHNDTTRDIVAYCISPSPVTPDPATPIKAWTMPEPPEGQRWHRKDFTEEMLPPVTDGWLPWRPLLEGEEEWADDDQCTNERLNEWTRNGDIHTKFCKATFGWVHHRTRRPLPSIAIPELTPPAWSKGWHNPKGVKSPGNEYRFMLVEELDGRYGISKPKPSVADHWVSTSWHNGNCCADKPEATYRVPITTPFPPPPEPSPVLGTPSSACLTNSTGTADNWRPMLPDELVQEGDEFTTPYSQDRGWEASSNWKYGGMQASNSIYRTKRPLPLDVPTATNIGIGYTPSPELVSICGLGLTDPDTITSTEPETNTQTEKTNAMNTQCENQATPAPSSTIQLPEVGSKWAIKATGGGLWTGTIIAASDTGIYVDGKRQHAIYTPLEWSQRDRTQILSKKDFRRQYQAQLPPQAITVRTGPSFLRRLRNSTAMFILGSVLSPYTGPALKTAVAFTTGLVSRWLS